MNKEIWDKVKRPPADALKTITGGRLNGKSDINPQWRYEIMTEIFGMCGQGWKYTIDKKWLEPTTDGQVVAFADITLYVFNKETSLWSEGIPANGGSMLIEKEKAGLHSSDEAYKMAITDALGTAMKMLGVAADIYAGKWDGSKYINETKQEPTKQEETHQPQKKTEATGTKSIIGIIDIRKKTGVKDKKPWIKFSIVGSDGSEYSTFNEPIAKEAKAAKEAGLQVEITFNTGKFGNDITALTKIEPEREAGSDDK